MVIQVRQITDDMKSKFMNDNENANFYDVLFYVVRVSQVLLYTVPPCKAGSKEPRSSKVPGTRETRLRLKR